MLKLLLFSFQTGGCFFSEAYIFILTFPKLPFPITRSNSKSWIFALKINQLKSGEIKDTKHTHLAEALAPPLHFLGSASAESTLPIYGILAFWLVYWLLFARLLFDHIIGKLYFVNCTWQIVLKANCTVSRGPLLNYNITLPKLPVPIILRYSKSLGFPLVEGVRGLRPTDQAVIVNIEITNSSALSN